MNINNKLSVLNKRRKSKRDIPEGSNVSVDWLLVFLTTAKKKVQNKYKKLAFDKLEDSLPTNAF